MGRRHGAPFDIEKRPNQERLYSTGRNSMVVLEPRLPGRRHGRGRLFFAQRINPLRHMLDRFKPYESSFRSCGGRSPTTFLTALSPTPGPLRTAFRRSPVRVRHGRRRPHARRRRPRRFGCRNARPGGRGPLRHFKNCLGDFRAKAVHIEPSFISPRWGLQGRLDFCWNTAARAGTLSS